MSTPDTSVPLRISDLVKRFPLRGGRAVHAVDGVSLAVVASRTLAIVGESGCGKSTIAKALVGLVRPSAGSILVGGRPVRAVGSGPRAERRRVQLVSQSPWSALNRRKTVRHIVTQPLVVHRLRADGRARDARARELLDMVELSPDHLDRRAGMLSGGELQRVTIARALAAEPDVLVLDEPTASLDMSVKATLVNLLNDLQRDLGLAYLLITHELDIARHLADHIAVMYLGEFVEVGDAEEVLARPRHPYTRSLVAAAPSVSALRRAPVAPLRGEVPSAIDPPAGCRFHTRCPFAAEQCREQVPALRSEPDERAVACLRLSEIPAEPFEPVTDDHRPEGDTS